MKIDKFGPYQTDKLLGRGGMGTVYRGTHEETGQVVALKVLSFVHADDDNFRERFALEIETLKKLRHPNIVELYGYGVQDGHLFYAMELIEGNSLQQELLSGRRFDWRETTNFTIAICQALKHAHDRGVIHRDLKPANLLLTPGNEVKLSDFGIAKLFGSHQITADRSVIGTADYMAPEQAEGAKANVRSDLYSLGSVMYALVTGKPPFADPSLAKVISDLRHATPILPSRHVPNLPAEFEELVMHLLQKEPERRLATALVLANHLRAMEHTINRRDTAPAESAQTKLDTQLGDVAPASEELPQDSDTEALSPTVAASSLKSAHVPEAAPTIAASNREHQNRTHNETDGSGQSTPEADHFTKVDPNRSLHEDRSDEGDPLVVNLAKIGLPLLLITLLSLGAWYTLKPATENQLYEHIQAAADRETPEALSSVSQEVTSFLDKFPGSPHYARVQQYQEQIELQRLHRSFEKKTRNTRFVGDISPVARAYLEALQQSRTDQETARKKMKAVIDLFSQMSDPETKKYVDLARNDLRELDEQISERRTKSLALLTSRMAHANKLSATDKETSQRIYRSIIVLYDKKPWAAEIVSAARQRLAP
jgi:serine/threonine-protein kinase